MNLVDHVIRSLNSANTFKSKLPKDAFEIEGMSGIKTRIFYNELCSLEFPDRPIQYLEIGSWKGSTICSALCFNENCQGTVIENWSEFSGPRDEFMNNVSNLNIKDRLQVFEEDFFKFDISKINKPIDIYLYDGNHESIEHYRGITRIWPLLSEECIIIIDDWNSPSIRESTFNALDDIRAKIIKKFEIIYTTDGTHTPMDVARVEFWNGIGIFVVSKNSQ